MRKTVEIEYVGIEDIQDILDDVYALMLAGHYVNVSFYNACKPFCSIYIMIGGFEPKKEYDYRFGFYMTDEESEVEEMNKCRCVINNLLTEVE